jgi:hypothetical protein
MLPVSSYAEVRPRALGEILDDGWRLYLADVPLLLTLSGLFLVPAWAALVLLLTQAQGGSSVGWVWPALAAFLWLLTGLGSGACQEAFHCWAEDVPARLGDCLKAACRRGLNHATAQVLGLLLPAAVGVWLLAPELPAGARWLGALATGLLALPAALLGLTRHAVLTAGQKDLWRAWRHSSQASGRHPLKATVLLANRFVLLAFAVLNLHLFGQFALWAAEAQGGFDVALPRLVASLGNPAYAVTLVGLAWWLLTPYQEASNYLFYVDARTRYEGLDLWYRVEAFFPVRDRSWAGAVFLALGIALLATPMARADDQRETIRGARQDIARIASEVRAAEPYPGGQRWGEPLRQVGRRLDPTGTAARGRFRWYFHTVEGFADCDRNAALQRLDAIDSRLAVLEDSLRPPAPAGRASDKDAPSPEQIKGLVPPAASSGAQDRPGEAQKAKPREKDEEVRQDDGFDRQPAVRRGPAVLAPVGLAGLGHLLLVLFLALLLAVVTLGIVLAVRAWRDRRATAMPQQQGVTELSAQDFMDEIDRQSAENLWRQADELARAGRYRDAVRALYLAILTLLHQAALIRYERTRTNGEYADQLRAHTVLHTPFVRLTGLFEAKWYGERTCQADDYTTCRGYAEDLRQAATRPKAA